MRKKLFVVNYDDGEFDTRVVSEKYLYQIKQRPLMVENYTVKYFFNLNLDKCNISSVGGK